MLVILQDPSEKDEGDLESYLLPADHQQVVTVGSLTANQQQDLQQLLHQFPDVAGEELGCTTAMQHEIDVEGAAPIQQQAYRLPEARKIVKKELDKMLNQGIVQPSRSPWASPP